VARRDDDLGDLLDRIGRRGTGLSIDDIGAVIGDALRDQRKNILAHVGRLFRLREVNAASSPNDQHFKNLHRRLVQVESEIRRLTKGGSR
jgi:hypothetical protein